MTPLSVSGQLRHGPLLQWCRSANTAFTVHFGREQQRYNLKVSRHNAIESTTLGPSSNASSKSYTSMASASDDQQALGMSDGQIQLWQLGSTVLDADASQVWWDEQIERMITSSE